jgi:hypothetical protein
VVNAHIVIEAAASKRSSCRIIAGRIGPSWSERRVQAGPRVEPEDDSKGGAWERKVVDLSHPKVVADDPGRP